MNVVSTGSASRRASSATSASIPKRRTSTPGISTGRSAAWMRASHSRAHSSTAACTNGLGGSIGTAPISRSARSRGISTSTGCENSRQLRSARAISAGAVAGSSSRTWSQVISANTRSCESTCRT